MAFSSISTPSLAAEYVAPADVPKVVSREDFWRRCTPVALRGVGASKAQDAALRALWNEEQIFFEFVCRDDSIVSPGEKDGLDHFLIGDVVEIFVGEKGSSAYLEAHATPAGHKTLYFFRDCRERVEAPDETGEIVVVGGHITDGWRAVLSIPRTLLANNGPQAQYEILAGRYDYASENAAPVLSCFPAQQGKPDFHRRTAFAPLHFNP